MTGAIALKVAEGFGSIRPDERDVVDQEIVGNTDLSIAAGNQLSRVLQFDRVVDNLSIDGAREVGVRWLIGKGVFALSPCENEVLGRDLPRFSVRAVGKPAGVWIYPAIISLCGNNALASTVFGVFLYLIGKFRALAAKTAAS